MKDEILAFLSATPQKRYWSTREISCVFGLSSYQTHHYLMALYKKKLLYRSVPRRGATTLWSLSSCVEQSFSTV
ncbi:FaeA/PapI family transcriptional regulator [Citrobacter portucalensis]|uniref:FaeA/PapI family transcriptional regulator n=1 Tax=Citrobacter portucalensis TaxID=1639133 RepID=UPI0028893464|nr:FaeA/PapI family transcriptional regulator [Citrobacter portucalensis]WNI88061.1 FaeA/PapI family transcriptional regulator [Citrobacter portucalensis]